MTKRPRRLEAHDHASYDAARTRLVDAIDALCGEFPKLTGVAKRRLITRLRLLTKIGRLDTDEDVEELVGDECPALDDGERAAVAVRLWAAWQAFLAAAESDPAWLGPTDAG